MRRARTALIALAFGATVGCEDPARPTPDAAGGGSMFVDSDPQGGRILIGGDDTGERTPASLVDLPEGGAFVVVVLDTGAFSYSFQDFATVTQEFPVTVAGPLTLRCTTAVCLSNSYELHSAGGIRFAISGAGPPFLYQGLDLAIAWPSTTQNSYASIGMATLTATVNGEAVSLGIHNVGTAPNYWAGRPLPTVEATEPYRVRIPSWITPPGSTAETRIRGLEVVHEVVEDASHANVLHVHVTWTNISDDSIYRLLDPAVPAGGVTYSDAWLGFILDADVGPFGESGDDLVSYDMQRRLAFAYDSDFQVAAFTGGWSDSPGLIGVMLIEGPGDARFNAWPRSRDFLAGIGDETGRLLLTATQSEPANHPDGRIGFAPDDDDGDYIFSVASGPITLPPGASANAHYVVLLAPPADGAFTSGALLPAGDPLDDARPLAAAAAHLFALADSVIAHVE